MLNIPLGASFHWNPYSPKHYTIVSSAAPVSSSDDGSRSDASVGMDDEEFDLAWATIAALRQELTDAQLLHAVQRLPVRTLSLILNALECSPQMMRELCEKERGNVIAQVMQVAGGHQCDEIVRFMLENADRFAAHQSGCIAFTRVFENATISQRAAMSHYAASHFRELAFDPFGNYVVQAIVKGATPAVFSALRNDLVDAELLDRLTENKFGSHVIECFLKAAPPAEVIDVCAVLLRDEAAVTALAFSKTSNYVIQVALKQLLAVTDAHSCALTHWCITVIPGLVANSQFAPNINRALGFQSTADRRRQK